MAEQARPEYRAVTAVGDLAQKLHNGTAIDVRACLRHGNLNYVKLNENLRQAGAPGLALFSACFREAARGDAVDQHVIKAAKDAGPDVVRPIKGRCSNDNDMDSRILKELGKVDPNQTVVVVFPSRSRADEVFTRLKPDLTAKMISASLSSHVDLSKRFVRHFATIENTKGLEFDVVLVAMLDDYDLSNDLDRNRLYVGITRAKQRLILLSRRAELSPFLSKVVTRYQSLLPIGPIP